MKLRYIHLLCVLFLMLTFSFASGQTHTSYFLQGVPQRHYLNPAFQPKCNIYIGMPVLSSLYIEQYNNSISFSDIFWNDEESGMVLHPLHPNADLNQFLDNFEDENMVGVHMALNLASFGFRVKEMYFSFDATVRADQQFIYPGDLISFLLQGNTDGQTFDFSALGMNATQRAEFSLGISRQFFDQLTIGIKPKLIKGMANVTSLNNDISLYTSVEEWVLSTNMEVQMSLPGVVYPIDDQGNFGLENGFGFDSTLSGFDDFRKLVKGNNGLGIDIGVVYTPISDVELSASLIDLGYINWDNSTYVARLNGSYTFDGISYNFGDTTDIGEGLLDSLESALSWTGSEESFRTTLSPKVFIGGRFFLTKFFDVGAFSRIDFSEAGTRANLVLSANWRPSEVWALSASYSPIGNSARTFGLGTSFRAGPLNLYLTSDFFPTSTFMVSGDGPLTLPVPPDQTNINLRIGLNLVFGCNEYKKLRKDKPMYYSAEY